MRAHLLLSLNLVTAPLEEAGISRCCSWDAAKQIQEPRHMAQCPQNSHVVMDALDRRVCDSCGQVVELLPEPNASHDVEAEKHGPGAGIDRLAQILLNMRGQIICLGFDTGLVDREGWKRFFSDSPGNLLWSTQVFTTTHL